MINVPKYFDKLQATIINNIKEESFSKYDKYSNIVLNKL